MQAICDRLGPATIGVFFERWMARLPLPLTPADRGNGYWWEVLDAPGRGVPHDGVRPAPPRPCRLRGAGGRQPRPGSSGPGRTIAAPLAVRDKVIGPLLAGVRTPRRGRPPATWTQIDRDYATPRLGMQALFHDLGIATQPAAAA